MLNSLFFYISIGINMYFIIDIIHSAYTIHKLKSRSNRLIDMFKNLTFSSTKINDIHFTQIRYEDMVQLTMAKLPQLTMAKLPQLTMPKLERQITDLT